MLSQGERRLSDPERGIIIERTTSFTGGCGCDLLGKFHDDRLFPFRISSPHIEALHEDCWHTCARVKNARCDGG
jgi:hypothetical protein